MHIPYHNSPSTVTLHFSRGGAFRVVHPEKKPESEVLYSVVVLGEYSYEYSTFTSVPHTSTCIMLVPQQLKRSGMVLYSCTSKRGQPTTHDAILMGGGWYSYVVSLVRVRTVRSDNVSESKSTYLALPINTTQHTLVQHPSTLVQYEYSWFPQST